MKVFLASPFSQFCDDKEDIIIENRWFFQDIIKELKDNNIDYFCSQEREEWGKKYVSPEESIINDVEAIKECDLFVAIPGNPISGGVHVEIGWASMLKKKTIIFLQRDIYYTPMIMGLKKITNCKFVYYDELIDKKTVKSIIKEILEVK